MYDGSELGGYRLNAEDHMIHVAYSDDIHQNYDTHLNGAVADNSVCQYQSWHIRNLPIPLVRWCCCPLVEKTFRPDHSIQGWGGCLQ